MKLFSTTKWFIGTFKLYALAFMLFPVLLAGCGGGGPELQFDAETGESNIEELDASLTEEQKQKLDGSLATAIMVLAARQQLEETGNCPNLFNFSMRGRAGSMQVLEDLEGKTVQQIISMTEEARAEIEEECG